MMQYVQIANAPRVGALGCVGCAAAGSPACSTCPRRGLGFTFNPTSLGLPNADWKTWAIIAVLAILAYRLFFGEKTTARRRAIGQARAAYKGKLAQIRAEHA